MFAMIRSRSPSPSQSTTAGELDLPTFTAFPFLSTIFSPARTKLFADYADNHLMTVYSEPIPEIVDLVKAHHLEHQFKWFSFVKGLDR